MNYIAKLKAENEALQKELGAVRAAASAFRAHLLSPKFLGFEPNGERKDWIATSDAHAYVEAILSVTAADVVP